MKQLWFYRKSHISFEMLVLYKASASVVRWQILRGVVNEIFSPLPRKRQHFNLFHMLQSRLSLLDVDRLWPWTALNPVEHEHLFNQQHHRHFLSATTSMFAHILFSTNLQITVKIKQQNTYFLFDFYKRQRAYPTVQPPDSNSKARSDSSCNRG